MLRRHVLGLALAAFVGAAGCSSGITGGGGPQSAALNNCKDPVRGKRYSLCGHVATASIVPATTGTRNVIGAVDATPGTAGGRAYTVEGGTFHAAR